MFDKCSVKTCINQATHRVQLGNTVVGVCGDHHEEIYDLNIEFRSTFIEMEREYFKRALNLKTEGV